jgi:hypothetical protein
LDSKITSFPKLGGIIFGSILVFSVIALAYYPNFINNNDTDSVEPYFGISFNGETFTDAKLLIDRTKHYTNLFVLQSGPISKNETAINLVCDYAVDAGLDIIVFFGWFDFDHEWQIPWLDFAKNRWGKDFLGVYLYDEPGGIQIDYNWSRVFHRIREINPEFYESISVYIQYNSTQFVARNYEAAKDRFIDYLQNHVQINELTNRGITSYTSDYGLYWFDYLAGYDTIFVELGWNHSTMKHIGLVRGAANVQKKEWGSIIVWNSVDRDSIDDDSNYAHEGDYKTGPEMFTDMVDSYKTGADYIIIFNYPTDPPGNPYGILTDEHFEVFEEFWKYMQENPEDYNSLKGEVALVLPENYAWGMRRIDDKIWGYWGPDEKSEQIWNISQELLDVYGFNLDIVYEDSNFTVDGLYEEIYYWNQTQ